MTVDLPEWVQFTLIAGGVVLAVWVFIALVVVYQAAMDHMEFLRQERERLGYPSPQQPVPLERWDATHAND